MHTAASAEAAEKYRLLTRLFSDAEDWLGVVVALVALACSCMHEALALARELRLADPSQIHGALGFASRASGNTCGRAKCSSRPGHPVRSCGTARGWRRRRAVTSATATATVLLPHGGLHEGA